MKGIKKSELFRNFVYTLWVCNERMSLGWPELLLGSYHPFLPHNGACASASFHKAAEILC
jgi:hypothetical protein